MPSFDVVSELNRPEVTNALDQARKELLNRYDFKDTDTTIEEGEDSLTICTASKNKLEAALEVIRAKMTKRGVAVENLEYGNIESASHNRVRQTIKLVQGIDIDRAKKIVKLLKEHQKKMQAAIQGDLVRVSAKQRDDLQEAIAFLRGKQVDIGLSLQFKNFRD